MLEAPIIASRLAEIQARIAAAAARAKRATTEITLIGVTKTHPASLVCAAHAAGLRQVGENRIQEAEAKIELLAEYHDLRWHLIGHVQRNKARRAAQLFDLIHSVDRLDLADALNRHATEQQDQPRLPILLQLNVSGEESKEGFDLRGGLDSPNWASFLATAAQIASLPRLHIQGLMTIAPYSNDLEGVVRPCFRALRLARDELARQLPAADWHHLSMGMSGDFELAIEEGATLVRVGTALFGER